MVEGSQRSPIYTYEDRKKDKLIIDTFYADFLDLIIFVQTLGLFYTAGIEFGFFDNLANWTEVLAEILGRVSSIGSFFISIGYGSALFYVLKHLYQHVYLSEEQREMNEEQAFKYIKVQLVLLPFILGETIGCEISVLSSFLMIGFAYAHAFWLVEVELDWTLHEFTLPYTFKTFFSLLAIPVVGLITAAIVDSEAVNENRCFDNLPELSKPLLIIPLSIIVNLLVVYHAVLADIDFKLRSPDIGQVDQKFIMAELELMEEGLEKKKYQVKRVFYILYKVMEIIERVIVTITTQATDEEDPEETGDLIRHLLIQYFVLICISIYYVWKNEVKRKVFTVFPRVAIFFMLWFGRALNNFNLCILELEEFAVNQLTYYNVSNVTDFSECFEINNDEVAIEDIEAIELQRLTDKKFWPALVALLFCLMIIGAWFYYIQPI